MNSNTIDTIEKALYFARANVESYWHNWAGDKSESDSLEKIDAALAELAKLEQPQQSTWEPVPDGTYSADKLLVHILAGRYVIATKATHDTGQDYWNGTSLSNDYRLCRRTTPAQEASDD